MMEEGRVNEEERARKREKNIKKRRKARERKKEERKRREEEKRGREEKGWRNSGKNLGNGGSAISQEWSIKQELLHQPKGPRFGEILIPYGPQRSSKQFTGQI